jgi:rRNA maturation endonuclease Nob1
LGSPDLIVKCTNCGEEVLRDAKKCPQCGMDLPKQGDLHWFKNLNPAEIFLLILGSIMLLIGLVAI